MTPRASVGLPVYNGEKYLREAIDSVLSQTYRDFDFIIADNASTDRTPEICREYAAKDSRVRYYRNEENMGAAENWCRIFRLSSSEYFKWIAADDAMEPEFLERTVQMLDDDPSLVLACSYYINRSEVDGTVKSFSTDYNLCSPRPGERFREYLWDKRISKLPIYALMRSSVLKDTHLIRPFIGSDDCLLVELALKGRFGQVQDYLLRLRDHPGAYHSIKHRKNYREGLSEVRWLDPRSKGKVFLPYWRRLWEYFLLAIRSDESLLGKLRMVLFLLYPFGVSWGRRLGSEVLFAAGLGHFYIKVKERIRRRFARDPQQDTTQSG